jgi:hypothetical protein
MHFSNKHFLQIGLSAMMALGLGMQAHSVQAQEVNAPSGVETSFIHYDANSNHITDFQGKVSEMPSEQRQVLYQNFDVIAQKELHQVLALGMYPHVAQNIDNLHFDYHDETVGSEAYNIPVWKGLHRETSCKVVLGLVNHQGTIALGFDDISEKLDVKIDPNMGRLFVTLHELAHCEADFAKHEGYHYQALDDNSVAQFDAYLDSHHDLQIGNNRLHDYFDETFADSYAALALLKVTNFERSSITFIQNMGSLRQELSDFQTQAHGMLDDPHTTEKSLMTITELAEDPQFINLLKNDTDGSFIYQVATTLASTHLNEIIASQDFSQIINGQKINLDSIDASSIQTIMKNTTFVEYKPVKDGDNQYDDPDNGLDLTNFKTATHLLLQNKNKITQNIALMRQQSMATDNSNQYDNTVKPKI